MKVLLVSPKDPDRPENLKHLMGGENTFTRTLIENSPPGVDYVHYQAALKDRRIAYTVFQSSLSALMAARIIPPDSGFQALKLNEKFDLIHSHTYCLKLKNYTGPVILSDSSSNTLFLKDYLRWSKLRIDFSYNVRRRISNKLAIYDPNLNLYKAKKLIVWSNFAKKVHEKLGCPSQKIEVIPPGINQLPGGKIKHSGFNILFVGVWFERKGGLLVLKSYRILKEKYPQVRLHIIGEIPKGLKLSKDIWQKNYVPRPHLIKEIFPFADVLILVPPVAEGYGLVVLEAASLGIPSIVSSVYALPELVENGKTGFVITPNNVNELVEKLEILINNVDIRQKFGQAAQERFMKKFWIEKTNRGLLKVYENAVLK